MAVTVGFVDPNVVFLNVNIREVKLLLAREGLETADIPDDGEERSTMVRSHSGFYGHQNSTACFM